jgi:signal transduction histidine kinase
MLPILVLALGLAATAAATFYIAASLKHKDTIRFRNEVDHVVDALDERIAIHVALLRATAALFAADENLTSAQFDAYAGRIRLTEQYPTLKALVYAPAISLPDRKRFVQQIGEREDPDFEIHPPGERAHYFPVLYVAPSSERRQATGFDLFSEENRYTAMCQARDTGGVAASAKVTVLSEFGWEKQPGFLLFVPIYRGGTVPSDMWERRKQLTGFIAGAFQADALFSGILKHETTPLVNFTIHDGLYPASENVLYRSQAEPSAKPQFLARERFDLPGHIWTLQFQTTPQFDAVSNRRWTAWLVCLCGLAISFALFLTMEALRYAKVLLTRSHAELETLVQERTARLQELISDLDHFSYSITHDMRAPLRAMQGYAQLLLFQETQNSSDTSSREYLRRIMAAAAHMDKLILDALDFSRVVRQEIPLGPVQTALVLKECIESFPSFQEPRMDIQVQGQLPVVLANEAALLQCFSILLGNAAKFVAPGQKPIVCIWADVYDSRVRIFFRDNGIGIAREHHERIFGMFQRLHTQTEYPGTGIGLAILRKIAARMSGRIGLDSAVGQGSTFWLDLHAYGSEARLSQKSAAQLEDRSPSPPPSGQSQPGYL